MLKAYTLLPNGDVLVTTDEGEFAIDKLPDELLTQEEVEILNVAFPNALRSDYKPLIETTNDLGIDNLEP